MSTIREQLDALPFKQRFKRGSHRSPHEPSTRRPMEENYRFRDRDEYAAFLQASQVATLLLVQGFVRDIYKNEQEKSMENSLLLLIEMFYERKRDFTVNQYATFRFYVFYVTKENSARKIRFVNEDQLECMVITDENMSYDEFVEAIYARFDLPKFADWQLHYYSKSNHKGRFKAKRFEWNHFESDEANQVEEKELFMQKMEILGIKTQTARSRAWTIIEELKNEQKQQLVNVNQADLLNAKYIEKKKEKEEAQTLTPPHVSHCIVVYFSPKVPENETIHHVYFHHHDTAHGPFPLAAPDPPSHEVVTDKMAYFLRLEPEVARRVYLSQMMPNFNTASGKRIYVRFW